MRGVVPDSLITADDLHLFHEGTHRRLFEKLGAHVRPDGDVTFAVWAPNAVRVGVAGDMNGWDDASHALTPLDGSGVWSGRVRGLAPGTRYKYVIRTRDGRTFEKADPFALRAELPPGTASVIWDTAHEWGDGPWLERRRAFDPSRSPVSIYEVHLGSWRRASGDGPGMLTYRQIAEPLMEHVRQHGFTHVELMPLTEHPFYGSWGYQTTGYFAPTARYGTPQDLMWLIDRLHGAGLGVILDWVPSHFPDDGHGLVYFDGTYLFEHDDPQRRHHPEWHSLTFDYDRAEVRSFLISSAVFWLDRYHFDGLRVDDVTSMLRDPAATPFLRALNDAVHAERPGAVTIAEDASTTPMVSRPTAAGGLGFDMKWDLGWMHDTLRYLSRDPLGRGHHQDEITFRRMYAYDESYVLPISHDEVAPGKGSLLSRMPGDGPLKLAGVRLLYAYQYALPGKKLLFMGTELGQSREWHHDRALDWDLLDRPAHAGISRLVAHLGRTYASEPALHELDWDPAGFEWIDVADRENSVLSFLRRDRSGRRCVLVALNWTPFARHSYRVGVPVAGRWREIVNTDAAEYGGSGQGNAGRVETTPFGAHGHPYAVSLTLPPLAAVYLLHEG